MTSVIPFPKRRQFTKPPASQFFFFQPKERQDSRMRELHAAGFSPATIASMCGRSAAEVTRIVEGFP